VKKNYKLLIILLIGILFSIYFATNYIIGKKDFNSFKELFTQDQKYLVKKYFFPYKTISQQEEMISQQEEKISQLIFQRIKIVNTVFPRAELFFKQTLQDIKTKKIADVELSNNYKLTKYQLFEGFYAGIRNEFPGSGFIDFHLNNLLVLSSRGVLGYSKNIGDELIFKQIKNDINEFIGLEQFNKNHRFSLKDLTIHNNKIFISYTEEIETDCWNTSVIFGEMNYEYIDFKKLFSPKECIHSSNNIDNQFNAIQSGGIIISYDDDHILLSIGDYRSRFLAQDKESVNGKIIKININNSNYEIVSMGHRNPQGLYFDKKNNIILLTEHGAQGGDEINLIEIDKLNKSKIPNYGWAIASAGEHYGGKRKQNKLNYEKYPLYKSHKEHGFIEPLKSFVPSIGISKITKIGKNKYVTGSLADQSLYFFELNKENKIINLTRVEVFERVRDMFYKENKLYLFLEDTPSIGIINTS